MIEKIKQLRKKTGAGMVDCKKALQETGGDLDQAIAQIKELGLNIVKKKADRIAAEGLVKVYTSPDKRTISIVEVNCETDFVAANQEVQNFAFCVAKSVANNHLKDLSDLLLYNLPGEDTETIGDRHLALMNKFGEKIDIRRIDYLTSSTDYLLAYDHGKGRIGTLIQIASDKIHHVNLQNIAKEIALHITASSPDYLRAHDIPQHILGDKLKGFTSDAIAEGKPEKIIPKIVEGKLNKFKRQSCLYSQEWIKDDKLTIACLLAENSKSLEGPLDVRAFVRFEKGQGIEKPKEDFVAEVMGMI